MIGSIIGWFFLGLLALLVLVFVLPAAIKLEFKNGAFTARARILLLWLRLLPRPEKQKKDKKHKRTEETGASGAKAGKRKKASRSFGEKWLMMKRLAAAGREALKPLLRHVRVNAVQLVLPVHAGDAADTAVRYGQLHAVIGGVRAYLAGRLKIRLKKLVLIPDFTGSYGKELFFSCKVALNPGIIFIVLFRFLVCYLRKHPYGKQAYKRAAAVKQAARATGAYNKHGAGTQAHPACKPPAPPEKGV